MWLKMKQKINIEMQYFNGCPNSTEMIRRVKEAIRNINCPIDYRETLVESNELAQELHFMGSPTVLVNGTDLERREMTELPSLNCRFYPKGLPSSEQIKKQILELID